MPVSPPMHLCGGVIISELWVMSSGYCINRVQIGILTVKVGRHDIAADDTNVQLHTIQKTFIHPKYQG
jgi:hypothetical protein